MEALLALEDGTIYRGESFGAETAQTGEICFNTSMTGYQEVLTDPSYRGQIVAMTYPLIGNTGINSLDEENDAVQVQGFVIEELSPVVSNWRAEMSLSDYLVKHNIPGIQGIDTRSLTLRLRSGGAMRACIFPGSDAVEAVRMARGASYEGVDFVSDVTTGAPYRWDPQNQLSRKWVMAQGAMPETTSVDDLGNCFEPLPSTLRRIVACDFGMKKNILRSLRRRGFDVEVVPADTSAADILARNPDGVFLSNGPGDPATLESAREMVRELVGQKPLFGICLGHQLLALALGGRTFKLKFGHRGANQPVKDLRTGTIAITSQNHGYAVDPDSLPPNVEITHLNLNDGTVAGLRHRDEPAFSVQYHPEAAPGPHDAEIFFDRFAKEVDAVAEKA
jgi:carbamoyl-phosphate synthase small subunit